MNIRSTQRRCRAAGPALALGLALWLAATGTPAALAGKKCDPDAPLPPSLHQALERAHELYDKGDYAAALARLRPGQRGVGREHFRLAFLRGLLNYQLGNLSDAEKHLSRSLALKPCFFQAAYNLAAARYELGLFLPAAQAALKAFELSQPPDGEMLHLAAISYLSGAKPALAEPLLVRLVHGENPEPDWCRALIKAYLDQDKQGPALKEVNRFLARWPADAAIWRLLANLELNDRRYGAAVAALEVAIRLAGLQEGDRRNLAELYQAGGAPLEAAGHFSALYGPEPTADQLQRLAGLYVQARQFHKARDLLRKSVTLEPTSGRYTLLAEVNLQLRDYAAARRAYVRAAALEQGDGESGPARAMLSAGRCAWQTDDWRLAEQDFLEALRLARGDAELSLEIRRALETTRDYLAYYQQD